MKYYDQAAKYLEIAWRQRKNYKKEVNFLVKVFRKHKIRPKLIYDIACGFGPHAELLIKKGYNVEGIDTSKSMLRIAKKRIPGFKTHVQDMRKLKMKKKADVILTLFNTICHLNGYKDFELMLRSYKKNLNDGGLIIFDTALCQRNLIPGFHMCYTVKDKNLVLGYIGRSHRFSKYKLLSHQVYVVLDGTKKAKMFQYKYMNFFFEIARLKKIIKKLGFKLKMYYDFSLTAKRKKNCSYVFVLQKS